MKTVTKSERFYYKNMQEKRRHISCNMPPCLCGHSWEDHHHGCIMNTAYAADPLVFQGVKAQECEATQVNGEWFSSDYADRCFCDYYVPNDWELVKAAYMFNLKAEKERRCQK